MKLSRATLAHVLAGVAVVCALVGAVGPAKHLRSQYLWPPAQLPAAHPTRLWYTPLLLSRHEPARIDAQLPCSPRALPDARGGPLLVFATARDWRGVGGLAVTRDAGRLRLYVGSTAIAEVSAREACTYALHLESGHWSLTGPASSGGALTQMPVVDGLFSGVDLRSPPRPVVAVETTVYGTESRPVQAVFWILAALAAAAALVLAAAPARRRLAVRPRIDLSDLAVGGALVGWWLIGPAFYDDGWVAARQRDFSSAHGFSAYYTSFGVNLPLGYWLEWLEHWLSTHSNALLVLRLPALVCLGVTWALVRWTFLRTRARGWAARWTLATGFLVGAFAWGMTLRPEPFIGLLVIGVVACIVRFVERPSATALAVAVVLVALALSGHPAGIVSVAPLLAAGPVIVRWVRPRLPLVGTIVGAGLALLVVLATAGADIAQRRAETSSLRAFGDETAGWRDELNRYSFLSQAPYGSSLRRLSVALILLAVLAYLLRRRRRDEDALLGLPATSLGIALVLFFFTPTKWPWHFGALIGLAAVAIAVETFRFASQNRGTWAVRPFVAIVAAVAAAAWSWNPRLAWGELDLRTLHWTLGAERHLTLSKAGGAVPVLALAVVVAVALARRQRLREAPWVTAAWTVPLVAVPLVVFTAAVLVADSAKTNSWTLARQNIRTLRDDLACGLANDALVPMRASMRPLRAESAVSQPASWVPSTPVPGLERLVLGPDVPARSPWFALHSSAPIGFFLTGVPSPSESLQIEWGRSTGKRRFTPMGTGTVSTDFGGDARPDLVAWRFYGATTLPERPPDAGAVRIILRSNAIPAVAVGVTAPVTYEDERLSTMLEAAEPSLALPNLVPYVPCVEQPRIAGIAEPPKLIIAFRDSLWPLGTGTSPFDGLTDLYRLIRFPLSDSHDPPDDVAVYELDRRISGGAPASTVATTGR